MALSFLKSKKSSAKSQPVKIIHNKPTEAFVIPDENNSLMTDRDPNNKNHPSGLSSKHQFNLDLNKIHQGLELLTGELKQNRILNLELKETISGMGSHIQFLEKEMLTLRESLGRSQGLRQIPPPRHPQNKLAEKGEGNPDPKVEYSPSWFDVLFRPWRLRKPNSLN